MRILTLILSIVILTLTVMPCMGHNVDTEGDTGISTHDCSDDKNSDNDDEAPCSPFCYCQCSHTPSNSPLVEFSTRELISLTTSINLEYINTYCFRYSFETWHPPSLS